MSETDADADATAASDVTDADAPAVEMVDVTKRFGDVVANDAVDLRVERGSVHALLGENGAGKTTLMNVLYGLYEPTSGEVRLNGEPRSFDSPRDAIDAGIGMIHQHFMLVDPMTVAENIALGNEPRKWFGLTVDREAVRERVSDLNRRYGFDVDPDAAVEDVGVGVQQRVEILKALYRGADVLILDEPTAVLTPQEVEGLYEVIRELTQQGKTIIFITHKLGEATSVADEITVLRDGRKVGTVDAADATREDIASMMVGRDVVFDTQLEPNEPGDEVLSTAGVRVTDEQGVTRVDDVDLSVRSGEVLGIAGVDGNGQAELVESITGLRVPDEGSVTMDGEEVTRLSRAEHIRRGMAYIPEDRLERGLVTEFPLEENAVLGSQHDDRFAPGGRIDWEEVRDHAEDVIDRYDVRPPDADAEAESLSGGNQQKFIVGRELMRDPSLVVASHPTRGVDIGSVEFIHDRLRELRRDGKAILLVSSKLDEVRALSDRLAVMYEGHVVDVVDPEAVSEEELGLLMAGERPDGIAEKRVDAAGASNGGGAPSGASAGERTDGGSVRETNGATSGSERSERTDGGER